MPVAFGFTIIACAPGHGGITRKLVLFFNIAMKRHNRINSLAGYYPHGLTFFL